MEIRRAAVISDAGLRIPAGGTARVGAGTDRGSMRIGFNYSSRNSTDRHRDLWTETGK